jgi:hypothetical protein
MSKIVKTLYFFLSLIWSTAFAAIMPSTDIQFYRPFDAKINPTETLVASCSRHSALDNRSDAWQCVAGKRVLDPCFIKPYLKAKTAICPVSPWQSQAIKIKLIAPFPTVRTNEQENLDMSEDDPWAITLTDGTNCLIIPAAKNFLIHGQNVKYSCDNHGFLLGHIQRCNLIWKMLFIPTREGNVLNTVEIKTAWY